MFALPLLVFLSFCSLITGYANPPPSGTVDLRGDASDRWTEILSTLLAMHTWDDGLGYVFMRAAEDYETAGCQDACITKLASVFASRYPEQYEELSGISDYLTQIGHAISANTLAAYQYYYEVAHAANASDLACTSIVTQETTGTIRHGRNLDFSDHPYANITAQIYWQKNGKTQFVTTQSVGEDVGIATGVCQECGFSFSYNWRHSYVSLSEVLACAEDSTSISPLGNYIRQLMEEKVSFNEAQSALQTYLICADAFIVLAGNESGEGVIITRNLTHSRLVPCIIDLMALEYPLWIEDNGWYLVQPNSEWWLPPPSGDDRLALASGVLDSLGALLPIQRGTYVVGQLEGATFYGLWKTLSTPGNSTTRGVLNADTVYTTLMESEDGFCNSELRM